MVRLAELVNEKDYLTLPQLNAHEITILWLCGFYDGPLDGIVFYKDQKYWFKVCDEVDRDIEEDHLEYYRRYLIIELSDEQLKEEEYWQELFREKVGGYWWDETGERKGGNFKPEVIHQEFYEPYSKRKPLDLSQNNVIGWFQKDLGSST